MAGEFVRANNVGLKTTYINKRFMEDLLLSVQMIQFCSAPDDQGKNQGDAVRWLSFPEWTEDVTALSETANDNQVNLSGTTGVQNADATLNPYGAYVEVSNFTLDISPVGTLDKISKRASDAGARALDQLALTQAEATTTVFIAHTGAADASVGFGASQTATSGSILKAQNFADCAAKLDTLGNTGFDHLGGQYGAVIHPNAGAHLMAEAQTSAGNVTWATVNQHVQGKQEKIERGRMGSLFNVAIFSSPNVNDTTQVDSTDVYNNIVIAKDGVGCSTVDGEMSDGMPNARVIVKTPGPNTVSQPLDTQSTVAWRWYGAVKLLDVNRVIKLVSLE